MDQDAAHREPHAIGIRSPVIRLANDDGGPPGVVELSTTIDPTALAESCLR